MAAILPPHDAEGHLRMAKETDDSKENDGEETEIGLDMSQTAVKKMIAEARARGYITYDQLNTVLPP